MLDLSKGLPPPFSLLQQFLKTALFFHCKSLHFLVVETLLTLIERPLTSIVIISHLWSAIEQELPEEVHLFAFETSVPCSLADWLLLILVGQCVWYFI